MFKFFLVIVFLQFLGFFAAADLVLANKERWTKQKLTYSVIKFPTKISRNDVLASFKYAFNQWSKILPKTFKKLPKNHTEADFRITFKAMDGPFQRAKEIGDIELDDDENWKYYKVGEKVDPQTRDLTTAAMDLIRSVLQFNNVVNKTSISFNDRYTDANGNYVYPEIKKVVV